jgi:RNA polymerase sigma-70 factor (ECF subfamily)
MTTKIEDLWQRVHDSLRAFIAKRVNDEAQVEDILQEVLLRVHRQIGSLRDPRRVVSWMYQVTRNAIIDYYRKPGREREFPAGLVSDMEGHGMTRMVSDHNHQSNADELRAELAGCLRPMIERLAKDYRDAMTLVELNGLTQQAAAKQMGISLSGMKSRVQRGRIQLKHLLDECCLIQLDRRGEVREYEVRDTGCDPCHSQPARGCR